MEGIPNLLVHPVAICCRNFHLRKKYFGLKTRIQVCVSLWSFGCEVAYNQSCVCWSQLSAINIMFHKGCFVSVCEKVSPREAVSTHWIVCVCAVLDLVSVESAAVLAQCARMRTPGFLKPPNITCGAHCRHTYTITTVLTANKHTNIISNTRSTLDVSISFWERSFVTLPCLQVI